MTTFSVVEFTEKDGEKTVQVVPSIWITACGRRCKWPIHIKGPITSLIRKARAAENDWEELDVRVLRCTG